MQVLPVLDLKGGVVVRGVAGRRHEYQAVVSRLTTSARPLDLARAFRDHFGLVELYLADLDAIAGAPPALDTVAALVGDRFRLWVDAGIRDAADARPLREAVVECIVAGLETLAGPDALCRLCEQLSEHVVFSLDLKDGRPLADARAWGAEDACGVARRAVACGLRRMIVLDLARVGVRGGTGTEDLCGRLVGAYPGLAVVAGGGVRGVADLRRLRRLGVRGALVASALHDGRLTRQDLEGL
jgi:phosphoribosylformimino-5-aminoimidazole carboxamide ribotide isomerase